MVEHCRLNYLKWARVMSLFNEYKSMRSASFQPAIKTFSKSNVSSSHRDKLVRDWHHHHQTMLLGRIPISKILLRYCSQIHPVYLLHSYFPCSGQLNLFFYNNSCHPSDLFTFDRYEFEVIIHLKFYHKLITVVVHT